MSFRFVPSMESLEVRETPAALSGSLVIGIHGEDAGFHAEQTRQTSVVVEMSTGAAAAVRHRMFAIVDRTQLTPTEPDAGAIRPTVVLQRLANPGLPNASE